MWKMKLIATCSYSLIKDKDFSTNITIIASEEQAIYVLKLLNEEEERKSCGCI